MEATRSSGTAVSACRTARGALHSNAAEGLIVRQLAQVGTLTKRPKDPAKFIAAAFETKTDIVRVDQVCRIAQVGIPNRTQHTFPLGVHFAFSDLRSDAQLQFRSEHRLSQLVLAQHPLETLYQGRASSSHVMSFGAFEQRRRHSVLMNGIDLI